MNFFDTRHYDYCVSYFLELYRREPYLLRAPQKHPELLSREVLLAQITAKLIIPLGRAGRRIASQLPLDARTGEVMLYWVPFALSATEISLIWSRFTRVEEVLRSSSSPTVDAVPGTALLR